MIKTKPVYAVTFSARGSAYENRREGDRIIQEASQPIRANQYNAYAYTPETFSTVSPEQVSALEPALAPRAQAPVVKETSAVKEAPKQAAVQEKTVDVPMPQSKPDRNKPTVQREADEARP